MIGFFDIWDQLYQRQQGDPSHGKIPDNYQ